MGWEWREWKKHFSVLPELCHILLFYVTAQGPMFSGAHPWGSFRQGTFPSAGDASELPNPVKLALYTFVLYLLSCLCFGLLYDSVFIINKEIFLKTIIMGATKLKIDVNCYF